MGLYKRRMGRGILIAMLVGVSVAAKTTVVNSNFSFINEEPWWNYSTDNGERILETESSWDPEYWWEELTRETEFAEDQTQTIPQEEIPDQKDTEDQNDAEDQKDTETQIDADNQEETEFRETESEQTEVEENVIRVTEITPHYENGCKIYDGNTDVALSCCAWNLPEELTLSLKGRTAMPDVGIYTVEVEAELSGEGAQDYILEIEEKEILLEIMPRPLAIWISDARRPYYRENSLGELYFDEEKQVKITGFLEDENGNLLVPEEYDPPEIVIDPARIQRESPMYQNGRERIYEKALVVKREVDGSISGNPGRNYCFSLEEDTYRKGSIRLLSPYVEEGLDYQILGDGISYVDPYGERWLKSGDYLQILPISGSGFNQGVTLGPLYEGGSREFSLTAVDESQMLLASSQVRSVSWNIDGAAPTGTFLINGRKDDGNILYTCDQIEAGFTGEDLGSGIKDIRLYLAQGEETGFTPEDIYDRNPYGWQAGGNLSISQEGTYRIMARMEDQVGNISYVSSKIMVLDETPPQVTIENVVDHSANSGSVLPVCYASDENLKDKAITFTLTGFRQGERQVAYKRSVMEKQEMVELAQFPKDTAWDDRYRLSLTAEDLAGNVTTKEITFSVNRFGSAYYIEENLAEILEHYYLKEEIDFQIHEVNVDQLVEHEVMVGWEDTIRFLVKDRDYHLELIEEDGRREYIYHIKKENFVRDGHYYIALSSTDAASNYSDNRLFPLQLEFAIDHRAPMVVVTGVEDGKTYEKERTIRVECIENLELSKVTVLVDQKEAGDQISPVQEISLREKNDWQNIRIRAEDQAGNQSEETVLKVWIGKQEEEETDKKAAQITGKEASISEEEESARQKKREETSRKLEKNMPHKGSHEEGKVREKLVIAGAFLLILKGILWFLKKSNR